MTTLECHTMLVLSTGHLSEFTTNLLDATINGEPVPWAPAWTRKEGWIWSAYADDCIPFPAEFAAIFNLARTSGCQWVMFDCDGPQIEKLPLFDW